MRKSRHPTRALAFALAAAGFVSAANASVTYSIANGGLESFDVTIDSTTINGALAGGILLNEVSSTDPSMPASYVTVCTDIGGTLYLGQNYTYDTPPTSFAGQSGVQPTWGDGTTASSAAAAIQNAAYLFYTYGQLTGTGVGGTTDQKAALQLAVWAALYNTTASGAVTGTRFSVAGSSTALTLAENYLTDLNAQSGVGNFGYNGYLLTPDPALGGINANADGKPPQELLIGTPVPEAPTVIAGMLLLLPFAASTYRILRRKRAV